MSDDISRRELLKRVTVAGAAVAVPAHFFGRAAQNVAAARLVPETLTAAEAGTLDAVVARLIPSDGNGPGALEAQAARYIDRALGGTLSSFREAYRTGLEALDRHARSSKGQPFAQLPPATQDAVLTEIENNTAAGFPESAAFFNLLLTHTIQGTFGDPYYGGNASFVGWDLIGYPGVRLTVAPAEQALDARPAATHKSAYDNAMFSRRKPDAR